jgi:hypothetical protein
MSSVVVEKTKKDKKEYEVKRLGLRNKVRKSVERKKHALNMVDSPMKNKTPQKSGRGKTPIKVSNLKVEVLEYNDDSQE